MLSRNTGFRNLKTWLDHLLSADRQDGLLHRWHERRWADVEKQLEALSEAAQVGEFIDSYASSLAQSMHFLVVHGSISEAADAAVNYLEELVTQAELFSGTVAASPVVPSEHSGDRLFPNSRIPDDLAQAA